MSLSEPNESQPKTASAWMLIVASIILFFMAVYKLSPISAPKFIQDFSIMNSVKAVMGENTMYHGILYIVLFTLVFLSAIMGFFYKEE